MREIADALRSGHPLSLLAQVSGFLMVFDAERHTAGELVPRSEFVASLLDVDLRETTALLTAWCHLTGLELEARTIAAELARRRHPLPSWLAGLGDVWVERVAVLRDTYGDAEQFLIQLRWPSGEVLTLAAMLDANLGYALGDGLAVPLTVDEMQRIASRADGVAGVTFSDADPADARARVEQGIEHSSLFDPPIETDSWPMARPLLEWGLGHLPVGGAGYAEQPYDNLRSAAIAGDFRTSSYVRGLDRDLAASIAEDLCWFAEFNCGDPLRWSPAKVAQLMGDWWARKIVAPIDEQRAMPDVLDAFVRYCGAQRGLSRAEIAVIRRVIDDMRPEYEDQLAQPPIDTATLLARIAAGLPVQEEAWPEIDELALLADRVGGRDVLDSLDLTPLPDEPFNWTGVPDDVRTRVQEVLELVDAQAEALFGVEFGTACRRLLAHVAASDPEIFRRRGSAATAACAVAFLVADENDFIGSSRGKVTGKSVAASFGLSSMPTSRVDTLRAAARRGGWTNALGGVCQVGLLTSDGRRTLIERRDWWRARTT